mmetsp:Transcript_8898/g.10198  ORF Transcript_8898/g.10198 Transcript_8898/m.10198 type:complete len:349 (-) Transcript_8898:1108-2154(-)
MVCVDILALKPCGNMGTCINGTCFCEPGWSQSLEFNYWADEEDLKGSLCNQNVSFLQALFILHCVLCIAGLIIQVYTSAMLNKLQTPRVFVAVLLFSSHISWSLIRTADPSALLGVNVFISFLWMNSFIIAFISSWYSQSRYLKYVATAFRLEAESTIRILSRLFLKSTLAFGLVCTFGAQLFWISALVQNRKEALMLVRLSHFFMFLLILYLVLVYYAAKKVVSDMKALIRMQEEPGSRGVRVVGKSAGSIRLLEKSVQKLERIRTSNYVIAASYGWVFASSILINFILLNTHYLLLIASVISVVVVIYKIVLKYKHLQEKKATRMDFSTSLSSVLTPANVSSVDSS